MARNWTPAQKAAMAAADRTLLVSAAAGSGKTATLTERIIRRLTDPDHPAELSRLLIVTFTRAAAAELKERISDALSRAIAEDPANRHLQKQLISLGGAHISTIDALYMNLVKAHTLELGLSSSFRIADKAELEPLSEQVMGELIDRFYEKYADKSARRADDEENPFALLENNPFADLCDSLSASKNDHSLIPNLLDLYRRLLSFPEELKRLETEADALETALLAEELDFFTLPHGQVLRRWIRDFTDYAIPLVTVCRDRIQGDEKGWKSCGATILYELDFLTSLQNADTYARASALFATYAMPGLKPCRNKSPEVVQYHEVHDRVRTALKDFQTDFFSADLAVIRRDIAQTAAFLRMLYDLLTAYDKRIAAEKNRRGICDFTDNRRGLLRILRHPDGSPSPIAEGYQKQFDEIYIDEYQDVDEMQDSIFRLIGGKNRFMVGDIKQSIYGFRGADPTVFMGYRSSLEPLDPAAPLVESEGNSIFMSDNFRCDESVIRVTNAVCGHIFRACPDSMAYRAEDDLGFSKRAPSPDYRAPAVQVAVLDKVKAGKNDEGEPDPDRVVLPPEQAEAVFVANEIVGLLRRHETKADGKPIQPKDIVILLRNSTHLGDFMEALSKAGVPTGCAELEQEQAGKDILHGPDMMYLLNLLRVIDNPDSDIPLSEILRAPFPGLSLEDTLTVRRAQPESLHMSLFACVEAYAKRPREEVNGDLQDKLTAFIGWISRWRGLCATQSAEGILRLLRQDDRCAARRSRAFLYLYQSARTCKTAVFVSLYDFLRFFERKLLDKDAVKEAEAPADENSPGFVRIMTMHKSKGLEFPVCFVCRCGQAFSNKSEKSDLIFRKETGVSMKLYYRTDMDGQPCARKTDNLLREAGVLNTRIREREEEMRVLYVAMTRTEERLYLVGTRSGDKNRDFAEGCRFAALSSSCYLDWILSGIHAHPEIQPFCEVRNIPVDAIEPVAPLTEDHVAADPRTEALTAAYRSILDHRPVPTAMERRVQEVPTKAPASRMVDFMLDRCVFFDTNRPDSDGKAAPEGESLSFCDAQSVQNIREALKLMTSTTENEFDLLLNSDRPTSAEKGTATHLFLQFCRYDLVEQSGVEEEIARLTENGFLSRRAAKILNRRDLEAFFRSGFYARVVKASAVLREWRFHRFVPLSTLTEDADFAAALGDRSLFVQGSIDILCEYPDGHLEICDYKTDHITPAERENASLLQSRMQEKHGAQLRQYALAVEEIYGKRPEKVFVYSLPFGDAVEIDIDRRMD